MQIHGNIPIVRELGSDFASGGMCTMVHIERLRSTLPLHDRMGIAFSPACTLFSDRSTRIEGDAASAARQHEGRLITKEARVKLLLRRPL